MTNVRGAARRVLPRRLYLALRQPRAELAWLAHAAAFGLGRVRRLDMGRGWRVTCHPASAAVFQAFRDDPEYRAEYDAFVETCRPGMVLLDVGANMGFFTAAACHFGGPEARAIAVEPSARPAAVLAANVALANRAGAVTLVRCAVGSGDARLPVLLEGAAGGFQLVRPLESRTDAGSVEATTIDALVERTGLSPTHVKIDVEGYEDAALVGGTSHLRRCRPVVLLELHGHLLRAGGRRPEDVLALLADLGYDDLSWQGRPVTPSAAAAMWVARLVCRASSSTSGCA